MVKILFNPFKIANTKFAILKHAVEIYINPFIIENTPFVIAKYTVEIKYSV